MNSINQNLPLFKNIQQHLSNDVSNYENIKPKNPLSKIDTQNGSKYIQII